MLISDFEHLENVIQLNRILKALHMYLLDT